MTRWFATATGQYLLSAEKQWLAQQLPHYFGQQLVVISAYLSAADVHRSPMRHKIIAHPKHSSHLRLDSHDLPFGSDSIDLLIWHHPEQLNNPRQCVLEIERVLSYQGQAIILGFNPLSLFGLWQRNQAKDSHLWFTINAWHRLLANTSLTIKDYGFPLTNWRLTSLTACLSTRAVYALRVTKKTLCLTPITAQPLFKAPSMTPACAESLQPHPSTDLSL